MLQSAFNETVNVASGDTDILDQLITLHILSEILHQKMF